VGYAGGKQADPTYRRIGDHAETIEIDFDPTQISYGDLLDIFWTSHRPTRSAYSRQYMSAIFTHSAEQEKLAQMSKEAQIAKHGQIYTEIAPATQFYLAEDYHQKYMLRQSSGLMRVYAGIFPTTADLIHSTAVARVNGYINGYADVATIQATLPQLGLSATDQQSLLNMAKRYH
jgi:peptide-methionine (S)-S-oxide reductase